VSLAKRAYLAFGKRALDLVIAGPALLALAPALATLVVLVRRDVGSPALFRQVRPGLRGAPFSIFKLRTMTDARGPDGALLPDAARLTRLGSWLRAHSLDELPQLISVVKGDMSLVGPRPLLTQYLERYDAEQARRHEVKPGITGLAQVSGRNALSWEEKLALDVWYVDHVGLALDLQILAKTALTVVKRDGIAAAGHATMPEFMGTKAARAEGTAAVASSSRGAPAEAA